MVGINPFARKVQDQQLEMSLVEEAVKEQVLDEILPAAPKPTAWQRIFNIAFGEGVRQLPAAPYQPKNSIRRRRRMRGKAKAARRAA